MTLPGVTMSAPAYELADDERTELMNCLSDDHDGDFSRADALKRLQRHNELPVREPNSNRDAWIADVEISRTHNGDVVKEITRVVQLHDGDECEECGYDRARVFWSQTMAGDYVEVKTCNLCEHEMRHRSTL